MPRRPTPASAPLLRAALAATLLALAGTAAAAGTRLRIATSLGEFTVELEDERAPLTVANFLRYVREGYYRQTIFHRVVHGFVVQGGGYGMDDVPRAAHEPIPNESGNGLVNVRGTIGLARTGSPHSGDAQFYVNLVDNTDLNPLPSRWGYAVFGRVTDGMDVVDQIGLVPTGARGPFRGDTPLKPVVIESVEILGGPGAQPPPAPAAAPVAAPGAVPGGSAPGGAAAGKAAPSGASSGGGAPGGGAAPDAT